MCPPRASPANTTGTGTGTGTVRVRVRLAAIGLTCAPLRARPRAPPVDESTPAFAVIPKSRRTGNIRELRAALGACVLW